MFDSITPDFIHTFTSLAAPDELQLTGEERAAAAKFRDRRLRDFNHGRYCARQALSALGVDDVSIGIGESRQPIWPTGIVGSITHTSKIAAAAVCRADELRGLGIDCEQSGRIDQALLARICHASEIDALPAAGGIEDYGQLLFSAKESVYKCIWPEVRRFVDFLEVTVALDIESNAFAVAAANNDIDDAMLRAIKGRWSLDQYHICTVAYL